MPLLFVDFIDDWLRQTELGRQFVQFYAENFSHLFIGEKLALGLLFSAGVTGAVAATNRFCAGHFGWPAPRDSLKTPKRKKGFGIKHVVLLLIALLPGGMVGMFGLYAIMGRANWRRDSLLIVGISIIPALIIMASRWDNFPWPDLRDAIYFSGLLGLVFGLLQCWVLIKLLREWWGEPDECVAWWPPLALLLQWALLVGAFVRVFGTVQN